MRTVITSSTATTAIATGPARYPAYYLDSLPAARDVGRGSPVGVETYQSDAYPRTYFDNLLEADWSRGRILYTALTPEGRPTRHARIWPRFVHGEPLNVTDLEVGPDGMLYFTTGGRNTAGGVWRLRYTGARAVAARHDRHPRRRAAGPAAVELGLGGHRTVKATMGATVFGAELEKLARNTTAAATDRARALYEMQRHGPAPSAALLTALSTDRAPSVRAAVMFMAGVQRGGDVARRPPPA